MQVMDPEDSLKKPKGLGRGITRAPLPNEVYLAVNKQNLNMRGSVSHPRKKKKIQEHRGEGVPRVTMTLQKVIPRTTTHQKEGPQNKNRISISIIQNKRVGTPLGPGQLNKESTCTCWGRWYL